MSNATTLTVDRCTGDPAPSPTVQALPALHTDLGGLPIRRLLPRSRRRLVGPWCFLDAYGPVAGRPMDVPPHPHIGLQTVSWLLEGEVRHDDSLGLTALARPGALNLMTAGRGIAHAERSPEGAGALRGVQLWIALPDAHRHVEPSFDHHPALPSVDLRGGRATVLIGALGGVRSPARSFSPIVGADVEVSAGGVAAVPLEAAFEHALVVLAGALEMDGGRLDPDTLYYLGTGRREVTLRAHDGGARALLLGGAPFGETVLMWWNFVARTPEEMAQAREDWEAGRRFGAVAADAGRRLIAPPIAAAKPRL